MSKFQDMQRILNTAREKHQVMYKGIPYAADYSAETLLARREWDDIFKVERKK
jgi:hypothetical protein